MFRLFKILGSILGVVGITLVTGTAFYEVDTNVVDNVTEVAEETTTATSEYLLDLTPGKAVLLGLAALSVLFWGQKGLNRFIDVIKSSRSNEYWGNQLKFDKQLDQSLNQEMQFLRVLRKVAKSQQLDLREFTTVLNEMIDNHMTTELFDTQLDVPNVTEQDLKEVQKQLKEAQNDLRNKEYVETFTKGHTGHSGRPGPKGSAYNKLKLEHF